MVSRYTFLHFQLSSVCTLNCYHLLPPYLSYSYRKEICDKNSQRSRFLCHGIELFCIDTDFKPFQSRVDVALNMVLNISSVWDFCFFPSLCFLNCIYEQHIWSPNFSLSVVWPCLFLSNHVFSSTSHNLFFITKSKLDKTLVLQALYLVYTHSRTLRITWFPRGMHTHWSLHAAGRW